MSLITDSVKRYVPASYLALVGATNSYDYTLDDLQQLSEFVQYRYYSTIAGITEESSVWNPLQAEFLGVLTTLEFIPAAIDYWGDQIASQSTSPTTESVAYFDRRADLWKVYDRLAKKAEQLGIDLGINTNKIRGSIPQVSYGDNGRNILVTTDPALFPAAFSSRNSGVAWNNLDWNAGNLWDSEE